MVFGLAVAGLTSASAAPTPTPSTGGQPTTKQNPNANPDAVAFGIGAATAQGKPDTQRSGLNYDVQPGSRSTDHFIVHNFSDSKTLVLLVYAADAMSDPSGSIGFLPRANPGRDASRWLTFTDGSRLIELTLHPQQLVVLPVNIAVPADATPGDHLAGIFAGLVAQAVGKGQRTQKLNFEQRITLRSYFRVSGVVHPQLSIQGLTASYKNNWNPIGKGSASVRYTVKNTGNVILGGPQSVRISGLFGATGSHVAIANIPPLLPGGSVSVHAVVKGVAPELVMKAKVTITPEGLLSTVNPGIHTEKASASFVAIPWVLLVIVLLLIGFVVRTLVRNKPRRSYQGERRSDRNRELVGKP